VGPVIGIRRVHHWLSRRRHIGLRLTQVAVTPASGRALTPVKRNKEHLFSPGGCVAYSHSIINKPFLSFVFNDLFSR